MLSFQSKENINFKSSFSSGEFSFRNCGGKVFEFSGSILEKVVSVGSRSADLDTEESRIRESGVEGSHAINIVIGIDKVVISSAIGIGAMSE